MFPSDLRRYYPFAAASLACGFLLIFGSRSAAHIRQEIRPAPPAKPPANAPAAKRDREGDLQARFRELHESFLKRAAEGPVGLLFLGDSITEGWRFNRATWDLHYGRYHPANFGVAGDSTHHVLWRIANGELENIQPRVVVLMIGTNNIGPFGSGYSAMEVAKANAEIVSAIHRKLPKTKVLLLGIFPRGADPKDPATASVRAKIASVNAALARLDDGEKTRYLDIGDRFLAPDGTMPKDIMRDGLHPSAKGYQIWADAMKPLLADMMR